MDGAPRVDGAALGELEQRALERDRRVGREALDDRTQRHHVAMDAGPVAVGVAPETAQLLLDYDWPGNVRELENCVERAIALTSSTELSPGDLPDKLRSHRRTILVTATGTPNELVSLADVEHRYVRQVLDAVGGNKTMAAKILGIDRRSLYRRLDGEPAVRPVPAPPR
jgi:two-component system response regulator HydG